MRHLTLLGVRENGARLLLVDDAGLEFTLDVDARLRAALRGDNARTGQLETKMDSALRPRDIQARIRAGESPEDVAQAAGSSVEKILIYAGPVLAERAHVADRAQRSSVRRKSGDHGARTLGDAVTAQLRPQGVSPSTVQWDAWRREDGRWTLTASYAAGRRTGAATYVFDLPGNYVVAENDDARWLVGEPIAEAVVTPSHDDLHRARERRLAAVAEGEDQLPFAEDELRGLQRSGAQQTDAQQSGGYQQADELGDDVLGLANGPAEEAPDVLGPDESTVDLSETAARVREGRAGRGRPTMPEQPLVEPSPKQSPAAEPAAADETPEPPARRPVRKSRGRASVPSWDEIMFGGGKND
ncbi:septation protein SepH [Nocardioides pacificus]